MAYHIIESLENKDLFEVLLAAHSAKTSLPHTNLVMKVTDGTINFSREWEEEESILVLEGIEKESELRCILFQTEREKAGFF